MAKTFKYDFVESVFGNEFEIEDIGNFYLEGITQNNMVYYLAVRSRCGQMFIFEYGPLALDCDEFPNQVGCFIEKKEFNDRYIQKRVNDFLHRKDEIKVVNKIEHDELYDRCRDLIEYMRGI